jgi:hypothetical protein
MLERETDDNADHLAINESDLNEVGNADRR